MAEMTNESELICPFEFFVFKEEEDIEEEIETSDLDYGKSEGDTSDETIG